MSIFSPAPRSARSSGSRFFDSLSWVSLSGQQPFAAPAVQPPFSLHAQSNQHWHHRSGAYQDHAQGASGYHSFRTAIFKLTERE
jgi:hypothetical protein